jgi:hypothetical protein
MCAFNGTARGWTLNLFFMCKSVRVRVCVQCERGVHGFCVSKLYPIKNNCGPAVQENAEGSQLSMAYGWASPNGNKTGEDEE